MSYNVTLTNGLSLTTIADYTEDNTTSLTLLGRGVPNYGQVMADNLVHLLENSSSTSSPKTPLRGQLWYNSAINALENYDGTTWQRLVTLSYLTSQGYLTGNNAITLSGDVTGTGSSSIVTSLAPMAGLTAGTYEKVTVDGKGRVTTGANLTTTDLTTAAGALLTVNGTTNTINLIVKSGGGGHITFADGTTQATAPITAVQSLGYTPVQAGTGTGQIAGEAIKIGRTAGNDIDITVNTSDHGTIAFQAWTTANFVNMGNGVGQAANIVKLGWSTAGKLKATIDFTDIGNIATESWVANGVTSAFFTATGTVFGSLLETTPAGNLNIGGGASSIGGTLNVGGTLSAPAIYQNGQHVVDISNFTFSAAASGYVKFPNGFIMQWGSNAVPANATATFGFALTITYPNAHLNAVACYQAGNVPSDGGSVGARALNNSQIGLANSDPVDSGTGGVEWLSWGY